MPDEPMPLSDEEIAFAKDQDVRGGSRGWIWEQRALATLQSQSARIAALTEALAADDAFIEWSWRERDSKRPPDPHRATQNAAVARCRAREDHERAALAQPAPGSE